MTGKPTYEELEQRIKELESEFVEAKLTQEELQEAEEKALRQSEGKYRTLFENMTQGAFRQRADGVLVDVNTAALKMFGLTKSEFLSRTSETLVWDVVHEDGSLFPGTEHPSMMALRTGKPVFSVVAGVRNERTGDRVWMEINAIPEFHPGASKPFQVMVTMHDITQRKQAAKVLQESENAYRTLAENLPGMVYRVFVRENNRMEFFNKMLQPMTGYRIEELTAGEVCSIEPLILSEDREAVITTVKRALQDHQPFEVEYRLRNRRGETRYFLERGRPIYGEDGDPLYVDGVILDVSARKVAEEALRKLDHEKAVILNATVEGMGLVDTSLRVVWANKVCGDRAGLPLEKLPGRYCYEIWAGRSNACVGCPILKTIETGRSEEAEIPSPDGRIWLHRGYPIQNACGQIESVVATAVDVTERKRAEEALLFKENIVRHSSSVIATCDLEGKMTYGNPSFLRKWGFDNPGEFLGRPFWKFWLVEDRRDEIMRILRDEGAWFGEIKAARKDGSIFDVQVSAATVLDSDGNPVALTSTSIDITERKQTEEKLRRYGQILDQISDAVISTDLDGYVVTWNKGAERIFGYLADEASGKHISLIYPPDQHEFLQYEVIEPLKERGRHESEVKVRRKSGEDFYAYLSLSMLKNEEGFEIGMIGNSIDLTDRRQMEEELRKSETRLRLAQVSAGAGMWDWDMSTGKLEWSEELFRLFGLDPKRTAASFESWESVLHPDDRAGAKNRIETAIQSHTPLSSEYRVVLPSGEVRWINALGNTTYDNSGKAQRMSGISIDITERKRVEEEIQRLAQQRQLALDASRMGWWHYDPITQIASWDERYKEIFAVTGYQQPNDEMLARLHPEDLLGVRAKVEAALDPVNPQPYSAQYRINLPDGSMRWIETHGIASFEGTGANRRATSLVGTVADITERKRAENAIKQRTLELKQLNDTLEHRVQERTQELHAVNEELKAENEERLRVGIELRESESQLRELSSALLTAQERERKVIAQEVHDSIGASLAAAKFKVEATLSEVGENNPQTRVALESVIPVIQGAIEEGRRIQMSLRPSILDDFGILATISWFCRQFESTYSNIHIKKEIEIEEHEVPDSLKIVIYRVLQEALNNVAKHTKASVALLSLRKASQGIQLVIRDSGQGFDLDEAYSRKGTARGLGLDSMRERIELSGGSFTIESHKGAGTVIQAFWPAEGKIGK
jgi:PAS domain S-box-containing protein